MEKKNHLKWLLPVLALLVLAAVVVALVVFLQPGKPDVTTGPEESSGVGETVETTAPAEEELVLYWNVDGKKYRSGQETRKLSADGYYYITLAFKGGQEKMRVYPDKVLLQKIDSLELMGLVFDEEGTIVDAVRADTISGGFAAWKYYVTAVEGKTIHFNTAVALDGVQTSLTYDDATRIYMAADSSPVAGMATKEIKAEDQIIAVRDHNGRISHIYVMPYQTPPDIYWNVERMYSSTTGATTRRANASGEYVFDVAVNGELTQVKTKDQEIANAMDVMAAKCFALTFDSEGYVTSVTNAGEATGGSVASWYHVTGIDERSISFTRIISPNAGNTASGTLHKDCKIYDVSGMGDYVGQPTELRYGDQVHCLKDTRGSICLVYVVGRLAEADIHWNVERKYDSTNKVSTRQPDGNGWYTFLLAAKGRQVTVRTKDVDIVNKMDGRAAKCFGVTYDENGVITNYYTPDAVSGGGTFASWYIVTDLDGDQMTVKKSSTGDVKTGTIADDCEIYNVSSTAAMVGEVTKVKVGDEVHTLQNLDGEICVIYVVTRTEDMPVYWNVTQKYDKTTKSTTRTREADGYYHFEMCYGGETVTMRVKDKSVADAIDSQAAKCVAVKTSGDVILKAFHPTNAIKTQNGSSGGSWATVTAVGNGTYSAQKIEGGVVTKTYSSVKMASGCRIYNVSSVYKNNRGEETTLQVGDVIHTLADANGRVTYIFVVEHYMDLGVYYNRYRKWDSTNLTTTRTPDADGVYSIPMAYNGQEVTVKTRDVEVVNAIDSEIAKCVTIEFDADGYAVWAAHAKNATTANGGPTASYTYVTSISDDGKTATADKTENGQVVSTYTLNLTDSTKVYNVSSRVEDHWAEETTLRVGDFIHGLKTSDGNASYIYVMTRPMPTVEHTCTHITDTVAWHAWDGNSFTESGCYVVMEDLELSARATIPAGLNVTLCLNGHTVKNTDRFFAIYGNLTICDHKNPDGTYSGTMETSKSGSSYGTLAYLYNEKGGTPTLTIQGGNFVHTGKITDGGLVFVGNKSTANGGGKGLFKLEDGVLSGGRVTGSGGAVSVTNNCAFEMTGGTITGCASEGAGAAVYVGGGCTFTMTGGAITGNAATGNGGGVDVNGTFVMTGGRLENNTATEGGNIRISKTGVVDLSGQALVTGGTAENGGNITMFGKLSVAQNAVITAGSATGQGSAISIFCNYADGRVEVNVTGGTIDGTIRYDGAKGTAVMNLLGGTVDTVNFKNVAVNSLFVGGTVTVKQLNVADGKTIGIHEGGLEDTASIAVSAANIENPFTTITDPDDAACFKPFDEETYKVENRENDLYLAVKITPHVHCVCGGKAAGLGGHVCDDTTEFLPWTETDDLPTTGNFYLTDNVTLSATKSIDAGSTLNLCLCGKTVTSSVRAYKVYGTLNIADCQQIEGTITSSSTGLAPVLYAYKNARVNLFGGNLTATSQVPQAGVLALGGDTTKDDPATSAVMYMYGGTISGGNVAPSGSTETSSGGNVSVFNSAHFFMYSGTISGGTATHNGGNLYIASGEAGLYGGTITDGTAVKGGGVYGASGYPLTVGGTINITGNAAGGNVYLRDGKTLTMGESGLEDTARIGISMETPGAIITITDPADEGCFLPDDAETYKIVNTEGVLSLTAINPVTPPVQTHVHCVCGGKAVNVGDHACDDTTEFLPWDETASADYKTTLPSEGSYYLTEPVTLTAVHEIKVNKTLTICLNGQTITGVGGTTARVFNVSGILNITDCDEDGDGKYGSVESNYTGDYGGIFYTYNRNGASAFNLYNGSLVYTGTGVGNSAGIGRVANTEANAAGTNTSVFNMYGGSISGGKAPSGGGLYLDHSGVFNMYAGTISGCTATGAAGTKTNNGGALYMSQYSTFNMHGGTITGCSVADNAEASNHNGGVAYLTGFSTANVYGGELTGNTAYNHGSVFFLTGSSSKGENTCANISGGRITGNTGNSAIYVGGRGNLTVSGMAFIAGNNKTDGSVCNVYLGANKSITVGQDGMTSGARVYVTCATDGTTTSFATVTKAEDAAYFFSDKAQYDVICDDSNKLFFVETTRHKHCDCCGISTDKNHVCFPDTLWTEVKDLSVFVSETVSNVESYKFPASGAYCLGDDVVLDKPIAVTAGQTITLCLNGKTLSYENRIFYIRGGTLNITDCQKDDTGYKGCIRGNTGDKATNAGVFYIYGGGTMNVCGGNLVGNSAATKVGSGGVGAVAGSATAVMNLYDGTISGGKTTGNGGNIIIWDGAALNMYGGTITGGRSNGGGNVGVNVGTFNLVGGTISGGTSTGFGGNIRVGQEATLVMTGGTVTGGTAANGGGNIYGNQNSGKKAQITITGGTITQGTLTGMGGKNYKGGAGLLNYGNTYLSGKPDISGNNGQNYLVSAGALKITGEGLEEGAQVYVSAEFTDLSKALGTVVSAGDAQYLLSDDTAYQVTVDADNKAYLTPVPAA